MVRHNAQPSSRNDNRAGRLPARLCLITVVIVIILAFSFSGEVQAQVITPSPLENSPYDAETFKIADQLQCPVCQGVTVAYSNSGLAQQMRALIKKKLEQGENRELILQYFVERYGESILTNPPRSGFTLLVWLLPVAGLLAGAGIVGYVLRGWKRRIREFATRNRPMSSGQLAPPALAEEGRLVEGIALEVPQVPVSAEVLREYEERVELELARFASPGRPEKAGQSQNSQDFRPVAPKKEEELE